MMRQIVFARPGEWIVTMPVGEPPHYWDGPDGLKEGRVPNRFRPPPSLSPQCPCGQLQIKHLADDVASLLY